jgi:hypothetical protein
VLKPVPGESDPQPPAPPEDRRDESRPGTSGVGTGAAPLVRVTAWVCDQPPFRPKGRQSPQTRLRRGCTHRGDLDSSVDGASRRAPGPWAGNSPGHGASGPSANCASRAPSRGPEPAVGWASLIHSESPGPKTVRCKGRASVTSGRCAAAVKVRRFACESKRARARGW